MRRTAMLAVLVGLAAALATGCAGSRPPTTSLPPPGSGGKYTGEPAKVVVELNPRVARSLSWRSAARASEGQWTALVRFARFDERHQLWERWGTVAYSPSAGGALELEVPALYGYEVSALAHGSGLKAIGRLTNVGIEAGTTTVVELPMSTPGYSLYVPTEVYPGGSVLQFEAHSTHPMTTAAVLLGIYPWNENDGHHSANNRPGGWSCTIEEGVAYCSDGKFPEIDADSQIYYQVRVCNKRTYGRGEFYCYYEPDLDEPLRELPSIPFIAEPPLWP